MQRSDLVHVRGGKGLRRRRRGAEPRAIPIKRGCSQIQPKLGVGSVGTSHD
jgi:hypothetical protein